jgi:hypothetical protein
MVFLRARVGHGGTGKDRNSIGNARPVDRADDALLCWWLEIEKSPTGFVLVSIDRCGCSFVETWSGSVEKAKAVQPSSSW